MKKFETPVVEIATFAIEDVVTTSAAGNPDCPFELPE